LVNNKNFIKVFRTTDKFKEQVFRFDLYWKDGIKDTTVEMRRSVNGRFEGSWLPPVELRNNITERDGKKYPLNGKLGAFGCDPYDADRTRFKGSSMLGFIGLTKSNSLDLNPKEQNKMFLRYNH